MPDLYTGADSLGLYLTGSRTGPNAYDQSGSLGGPRLNVRVPGLASLIPGMTIPPIIVDYVSGTNGEGEGVITADGANGLTWTPPGGTVGSLVTILDGETKILEGNDVDKFVIVTRDGTAALTLEMPVVCLLERNNVMGMGNITDAQRVNGGADYNRYRGEIFFNGIENPFVVGPAGTDIKWKINTLGTVAVSDIADLTASGSGIIITSGTFADWPKSGWCRVERSSLSLRENVYYSDRTDTQLTIPAAGRGLLGTSADAGAADDNVYPIPGIRLALKALNASGELDVLADENTAPTGVGWSTEILFGSTLASLADGDGYGIYIHNEIPSATVSVGDVRGCAKVENSISRQWVFDGNTYETIYSGHYAIEETALKRFETHIGEDADPDLSAAPDDTSTTYPLTVAVASPVSGEKEIRTTTLKRSPWGLTSRNTKYFINNIDTGGLETTSPLSIPENVTAEAQPGGFVDVGAVYLRAPDIVDPADTWNIYTTTNGVDPDPLVDTPTTEPMTFNQQVSPNATLSKRFGSFIYGTDFRVVVTAARTSPAAESTNTNVVSATVDVIDPVTISGRKGFHGVKVGQPMDPMDESVTEIIDVTHDVRIVAVNGKSSFYVGPTLIWALVSGEDDRANASRLWVPSDNFRLLEATISGAGGADPIEVVSATEIYIVVNGVRRVKIDVTAGTIEAIQFASPVTMEDSLFDGPLWQRYDKTVLQVWDSFVERWIAALNVDAAGTFETGISINALALQAYIEGL